jgi:hypothetical protein
MLPAHGSKGAAPTSPEKVARVCDVLHECVDRGLGENPEVFATALNALRRREAACWDHPVRLHRSINHLVAPSVSAGGSFRLRVQRIANDEFINRALDACRQRGGRGLIFTRAGSRRGRRDKCL